MSYRTRINDFQIFENNGYSKKLIKELNRQGANIKEEYDDCYDFEIKEISSRTGRYDENIHKFVKDRSPETVTKWYKADYSKCRIMER